MRRAQYSMEFILFTAVISIVFVGFLVLYTDMLQELFSSRTRAETDDLGNTIRAYLVSASSMHSGFSGPLFDIPDRIAGKEYTVNNTPYLVILNIEGSDNLYNIPYTIGKIRKGSNFIWNVQGVVAASDHPPILRPDGNVNFTQCNDLNDNDIDGLIDFPSDSSCADWQQDFET